MNPRTWQAKDGIDASKRASTKRRDAEIAEKSAEFVRFGNRNGMKITSCSMTVIPFFSAESFAISAFDSVQASGLRNFNQLAITRFAFRVSILPFKGNFDTSALKSTIPPVSGQQDITQAAQNHFEHSPCDVRNARGIDRSHRHRPRIH